MASSEDSDKAINTGRTHATAPAEGGRRALRGYMGQYEKAGAAIYAEFERGQLPWIGVADRSAGIADDLVLGFDGLVVGHQFKTAKFPATFTTTCSANRPIHSWLSPRQTSAPGQISIGGGWSSFGRRQHRIGFELSLGRLLAMQPRVKRHVAAGRLVDPKAPFRLPLYRVLGDVRVNAKILLPRVGIRAAL